MLRLFFIAIIATLFIGCSGSSSSESESESSYLSPPLAPINNSLVPITQSISLEFSAVMDPSSFSEETLYIKDDNGDVVSSTYTQDGDYIVVLTPSSYFKMNTEYSVTVDVGIKDTGDRTLSKPYSFTFTTENSGGDTTAPILALVKPLYSVTSFGDVPASESGNVDISTKIAIQFSKDIDLSKSPDLFLELVDTQVAIPGTTEVKGSVLVFTPDTVTPLLSDTIYEIKIADPTLVYDLYGNQYSGQAEWFFRTKMPALAGHLFDSYNLADMVGHKELATATSLKGTPIAATYSMSADFSQIFMSVATDLGVELYNVNMTTKDVTYNTTLTFPSEVKCIKSEGYEIIIGTAKDGIYIFKDDPDDNEVAFLEVFHYDEDGSMGAVYGVDSGWNAETYQYYLAAVSPTTGLYIFEYTEAGLLSFKSKTVQDESAFIDVKTYEQDGSLNIGLADYNNGIVQYTLDGTEISSSDINGSTRYITNFGFASTTLGIAYDNGSSSYHPSSGFANSFFTYSESFSGKSVLYGVDKDRGVEYIDLGQTTERSRVTLANGEKIVTAFTFKDQFLNYSYLVVLGSNNSSHIFNAIPDVIAPYMSSSVPADGAIDQYIADIVTITFSEILDLSTINASNFIYTDENSASVPFDLTTTISGSSTIITLSPTGGEQSCTNDNSTVFGCDVIVPSGIKDIVGNPTVEKTIHFESAY